MVLNFSVSNSALQQIRRIFHESGFHDPIAKLYEQADAAHLFDNPNVELLQGDHVPTDFPERVKGRFEEVKDQLKSSLMIRVCERAGARPDELCDIGGISFVMPPQLANIVDCYQLTFETGKFWLKGADGIEHTLLSLANKRLQERMLDE